MEGFVTKRGHLITNWKVRWFVLESGEIKYFTDKTKQRMKGRYILRSESIVSQHADMGLNKNVVLIFTTSHPFRKKALYFSCDSGEAKTAWCAALNRQIEALKTGVMPPAPLPTIIEKTIQSVDNMASRINTKITGVFSSGDNQNEADMEELLRGRPVAVVVGADDQSLSFDSYDSRPVTPKPPRPTSKNKMQISSVPIQSPSQGTATVSTEAESSYSAVDYDSSDTDGSANEQNPYGRNKKTSDSPRVRGSSLGSNQSAALAAEALNSSFYKKKQRGSDTSTLTTPSSARPSAVDELGLPRVSSLLAEEAAVASNRKLAAKASVSGGKSGNSSTPLASRVTQPSSTAKPNSSVASSSVSMQEGANTSMLPTPAAPARATTLAPSTGASDISRGGVHDNNTATGVSNGSNQWIEARTADGEVYYYHKITRMARWDKPEAHVVEAMESRMRDLDLAAERSVKERKDAMERVRLKEQENEQIKDEKMGEIERTVQYWAKDKTRAGRELSFPELLRDLAFILPSDLLLIVYESNHRAVLDALQEFSVNSTPSEVKKAYLRVVRFVHPDKLPSAIAIASKLLVERVFIFLTEKYDMYRKAHDLG